MSSKARLRNFESKPAQEGLLTRIKNKDPSLHSLKFDKTKDSPAMREKSAYKTAMVTLRIDQFENAGDLDFMLKNIVGREDYKRRFVMTEHTHETQKLVSRIE